MQKFIHLLGCHAIGINSSLIFFNCFVFSKSNMPIQKSDKNKSIRIIFIKFIIYINIIQIYTKNTHFITTKRDITRIFIKKKETTICVQYSKKFLISLLVTKESEINFNAARQSSTASSHSF